MPQASENPDTREKQRIEALMEIAEALKAMQVDMADIRAMVRAIATKR